MALTWGDSGNWVKLSAENDVVRGNQKIRDVVWYATGATAGSTLMELVENSSGATVVKAVAEAAQFSKEYAAPSGEVAGIKLSNLDAGEVYIYFEEEAGLSAKGKHDDTAAGV